MMCSSDPLLPASPGDESRQMGKVPPGGGPVIHTPSTWANTSWASFSLGQTPRCWDTGRIRPLLLPRGGKEIQMSKAKASLYSLHPWDPKCRPPRVPLQGMVGNHPTRPGEGGRIQIELLVCVCLPECLPFPCPSSYLLTGASLPPDKALPSPTAPPSGALCLAPRGTSPGSLPHRSPISGLRCTLYCHSPPRAWIGFRNGTESRGGKHRTTEPDRGRGLGTSHPST